MDYKVLAGMIVRLLDCTYEGLTMMTFPVTTALWNDTVSHRSSRSWVRLDSTYGAILPHASQTG